MGRNTLPPAPLSYSPRGPGIRTCRKRVSLKPSATDLGGDPGNHLCRCGGYDFSARAV